MILKPASPRDQSPGDSLAGIGLILLVACIVATPLIPSDSSSARDGSGVLLIMFELILLVAWALAAIRYPRFSLRFCLVDGLVLSFAAWQVVATLAMLPHGNARSALNALWQSLGLIAIYWLLRQWLRTATQQRLLCIVMLGLATSLSVLAYDQYFVSLPRDRAEFQSDPDAVLRKAGLHAPPGSAYRELFANRINSKEPFATFSLTNSLAGFLAPWLVLALGILGSRWFTGQRERPMTVLLCLIILLLAGCILITKSRSAVLGCLVGIALLSGWTLRNRWHLGWKVPLAGSGLAILLVLAGWSVGALDRQVVTEATKSLGYRWEYWQATAAMIASHSIWGIGLGNFQEYYAQYKLPQSSEMILDPHNFLMELAATGGIPALLLFLAILASVAVLLGWSPGNPLAMPAAPRDRKPATADGSFAWTILAGGILGPLIANLAALQSPPSVVTTIGTMLLMVIVPLLARSWVQDDKPTPIALPLSAALVLLVNLLAAGGIGFPGVAICFWVLLALIVNSLPAGQVSISSSRSVGITIVGICGLSLGAYWLTSYGPVIEGGVQENRVLLALQSRQFEAVVQRCERWSKTDPWSPEPFQKSATAQLQIWHDAGELGATDKKRFSWTLNEALRRDSHSHLRHREAGNLALRAWRNSNQTEYLEDAIGYYRRATVLYPNGSLNYAQLALSLHLAGRDEDARSAAEMAFRLDEANPHRDQKLAQNQLFDLPSAAPFAAEMPAVIQADSAEQILRQFRNAETP